MPNDILPTPETMLIGIALTQPKALEEIDHLAPSDFEDDHAGAVWATILKLSKQGRPHNVASVSAIGDHDRELLTDLAYTAPIGATAGYYADLVERQAVRRRLQETGTRIAQLATESELDQIPEAVEHARRAIDDAARMGGGSHSINAGDHFAVYLDTLGQPVDLTPTPWVDLNHLIGGWRPGALYVVGARPGAGKTIFGLQAAVGLQQEGTVLFSSLEMSRAEIQNRLIAQTASVSLRTFETTMDDQHWNRITRHSDELVGSRIQIDDRPHVTTLDIRSEARSLARRGKLSAVVVDYLQLMSSPKGDKRPRHEVVADYSRQLKLLARELEVPVIAMSQLNRDGANPNDPPRISQLRESGAVEQDADVIFLLHQKEDQSGDLYVGVGKNRHGPRGSFKLSFEGHYARVRTQPAWTPEAITA